MPVDWSLGRAPDTGGNIYNAFLQGQQQRKTEEADNALKAYAMNQTPEALNALAQHSPQFVIQERARMEERTAAQAKAKQEAAMQQVALVGKLAAGVKAGQIPYAVAIQFAQQQNLDVSQVPQEGDPNLPAWLDQQIAMSRVFGNGGMEGLTTEAKNWRAAGGDLDTPEGQKKFMDYLIAKETKTIPFTEGGGVGAYNPITGQTNMVVTPNPGGASPGAPAGKPSQTKTVNGKTYVQIDGKWYEGGPASQAPGGFRP